MDRTEITALRRALDELKATATLTSHFIFAWQGPDGNNWMAIERYPRHMNRHRLFLRAEARHQEFFEGRVRYLQDRFVFRADRAEDILFRQAFEQTLSNGGLRDVHPWFKQGQVRRIRAEGDVDDIATWFDDPEAAAREVARREAMGLRDAAPDVLDEDELPPEDSTRAHALDLAHGVEPAQDPDCQVAALDLLDGL